jgi:hypothetical protein
MEEALHTPHVSVRRNSTILLFAISDYHIVNTPGPGRGENRDLFTL